MKKPRKKIVNHGWGVKWRNKSVNFYPAEKDALKIANFYNDIPSIIFRCKIEEVTK